MENWGLIICNEANMLLDNKDFSFQTKITIAFIITHEIAHQWFGNIVTMVSC
jgi:aminopeptidase N